jgi:hypothetical protein
MKTMKNLNKTKIFFLAIIAVAISSCSNDDKPVNEEELITTVRTTLFGGGQTITLTSRDLDGDGPNPPVITPATGSLSPNTTYNGTVTFLNESVTPADDITVEVEEEGVDHQIFYQAPSAIGTFTYLDADANGKPIGLDFTLTTGSSSTTGNLTVTLRHLPNKSAAGVASGDITNAGGSTDAAVTYPISIGN